MVDGADPPTTSGTSVSGHYDPNMKNSLCADAVGLMGGLKWDEAMMGRVVFRRGRAGTKHAFLAPNNIAICDTASHPNGFHEVEPYFSFAGRDQPRVAIIPYVRSTLIAIHHTHAQPPYLSFHTCTHTHGLLACS